MEFFRAALLGSVIATCACSPSAREHRSLNKDGSGQTETVPRKALVLRPVRTLDVDLEQLAGAVFTPGARVIGTDGTASFALPGPFPGKVAHVAADGKVTVTEGRLVADAPLRFVRDADRMRAVAFDGGTTYAAIERVTAAVPWSATGASSGCCAWWEHTLWRAAPGALDAGLLRAVTPPNQAWSVIDLHQPGAIEPRWRVLLTQGQGAVVAAAVSPRADQLVLVVATPDGAASVQARRVTDGGITWSADLGSPASEWRRGDGRIAYRRDGARIAVLVQDPGRCESCTAIEVFDTVRGDRLQRVGLETIFAPRFTTIGLTDDTVWVFEHVPPSSTDLATRPQRCQYEARDLEGHTRRAKPPADWGLSDCTVWAMAPRYDGAGVTMLGQRDHRLLWLTADAAP